tara:strand:+ start:2899 stop:3144 length:246 start_codon:yes stop_codon:yes gene_type:complete
MKYEPAKPLDKHESTAGFIDAVTNTVRETLNQVYDEGYENGQQVGMALALVYLKQGKTEAEILGEHPMKEDILKSLKGETT